MSNILNEIEFDHIKDLIETNPIIQQSLDLIKSNGDTFVEALISTGVFDKSQATNIYHHIMEYINFADNKDAYDRAMSIL